MPQATTGHLWGGRKGASSPAGLMLAGAAEHSQHSGFDAHARLPRVGRQAVEGDGASVAEPLEHSGVDVGLPRDGGSITERGGDGLRRDSDRARSARFERSKGCGGDHCGVPGAVLLCREWTARFGAQEVVDILAMDSCPALSRAEHQELARALTATL